MRSLGRPRKAISHCKVLSLAEVEVYTKGENAAVARKRPSPAFWVAFWVMAIMVQSLVAPSTEVAHPTTASNEYVLENWTRYMDIHRIVDFGHARHHAVVLGKPNIW